MPLNVYLPIPPPTTASLVREINPYGPTTNGFSTGLDIEVDASARTTLPALAAVRGMVTVVPHGGSATLVLQPVPSDISPLGSLTGGSAVAFVYRNIDWASLGTKFEPRIAAFDWSFTSNVPLATRLQNFMSGAYSVYVPGGEKLGDLGLGTLSEGRLLFEIVFPPGGLSVHQGWPRVLSVINPSNEHTRRLDPVSFYRLAKIGTGSANLALSHANHALLDVVTRRTLLEVRDEFDDPVTGNVKVSTSSGAPTTVTITAGMRGHTVLATAAAGVTPPVVHYEVSDPNHVFTKLPSGNAAEHIAKADLAGPSHWAIQRLFMADIDDAANWFVQNTSLLQRFTSGNRITPLIDGVAAFAEMVRAMRTVTTAGHFIRYSAWWLQDSIQMIRGDAGTSFHELTTAMATAGARIRAMLWADPTLKNFGPVTRINGLPQTNGIAILDDSVSTLAGSIHQKFLVVEGSAGGLAFCGGMDINETFLDDPWHTISEPFHDVHAKVEGPAAGDINATFVQRWSGHPDNPGDLLTPLSFASSPGNHFVQVSRTYPPREHFSWLPAGDDLGTLRALRRAIQKARRFIYLEDQYLTPYPGPHPYAGTGDTVGILTDLIQALNRPSFECLLIVIPNAADQPQNRFRRRNFIAALRAAAPLKILPFYLVPVGGAPQIYVHSKVWIVDDVYVKIGSSNCNRRSMTNDSEIDLHVIDGALQGGARRFAKRLRMQLWGEHLQLLGSRQQRLEDVTHALSLWRNPPPGARVRPYEEEEDLEDIHLQSAWDSAWDPDGRIP